MVSFCNNEGVVVPAVTADEMREIDRTATEETGPSLFQMMENAGRNLAGLATDLLGSSWQSAKIVVLAGTGGNGGGGICAARHLANHRADVTLVLADPATLSEAAKSQYAVYRHTAGSTEDGPLNPRPDFIIDALIGYGLRAAPRGRVADLIRWANTSRVPVLALDVPSGLDSTSGAVPGEVTEANWTLTLALPKTGLLPELTGGLYLGDIGIPAGAYRRAKIEYISPFGTSYVIPLVATADE